MSAFHEGERAVQERSGVRDRAELLGRMYRPFMLEQHRALFAQLPFIVVGSMDAAGQPWASVLSGAPGLLSTPDERTLLVSALPRSGDPLASALVVGAPLGLLGIQLETRRRNRLNGRVLTLNESGFRVRVAQSFGNCPQYITPRTPASFSAADSGDDTVLSLDAASLPPDAMSVIERADTAFIASASAVDPDASDTREGVDVSHRGGEPGFIHVERGADALRLTIEDYPGNNAFNTLGNLTRYPYAGLALPDFASGALLQLAGPCQVRWAGSARQIELTVQHARFLPGVLPGRWQLRSR